MVGAKASIILNLDDVRPLAQTAEIVNNEFRTASDLWEALKKLYTTSNAQAIINLNQDSENLEFKDWTLQDW